MRAKAIRTARNETALNVNTMAGPRELRPMITPPMAGPMTLARLN
jgi:hypothetical protein